MAIYLGNLTTDEVCRRLDITISASDKAELERMRNEGAWHCYDLPFMMMASSRDNGLKVGKILQSYHPIKRLQICL